MIASVLDVLVFDLNVNLELRLLEGTVIALFACEPHTLVLGLYVQFQLALTTRLVSALVARIFDPEMHILLVISERIRASCRVVTLITNILGCFTFLGVLGMHVISKSGHGGADIIAFFTLEAESLMH